MAGEYSVPSLERALTLLEALAACKQGLTISEMSRRLEMPKSSVHLIARTLEQRGYLHRNQQTGRLHLGLRLLSLSTVALESLEFPQEVRPLLEALVERTQLTAHMGVLSGNEAVLIEKVPAPGLIQLATWVGRRMAIHCTSLGKALAAFAPEQNVRRWVVARGLTRHNARTIVTLQALAEELARVREQGYAVDDEEEEIGLRCVGAPVFGADGAVAAAISVSGSKSQVPLSRIPLLGATLTATAADISAHLARRSRAARA